MTKGRAPEYYHERTQCGDGVYVSTITLDVNHGKPDGPAWWYETMIFGGKFAGRQRYFTTADEAREGHKTAVKLVMEGLPS